MIQRILVPLDGSCLAETALAHAAALAASLGTELLLLRVVEAHSVPDPMASGIDWRLRRAEAEAYLGGVANRLRAAGVEAATAVVAGKAADKIVGFARARGADLVILSAHGRGEASRFPLGGTVQKVLSNAPFSVMVVRPAEGGAAPAIGLRYRRIVVPVNGSAASEWALCLAASIARQHDAELLMLQIAPEAPPAWERVPRSAEETELVERLQGFQRQRVEKYLHELAFQLADSGIQVRGRVAPAPQVARGIQEAALEEGADLLVLSAHAAGGAAFPHGGVAEHLLAQSAIPVLVLQDLPGEGWEEGPRAAVSSHR